MSRLGRTLGSIVSLLVLPLVAAAQPPPPPSLAPGTGIIVGQVVDAATGKGVSSAVVTLAGARRVMTTADGRFAFRNLPAGSHTLTAAKSSYIDGAFGMRRPGGPTLPIVLADGERRGDLTIWLSKHGAISGTIVDEAGEPLVGIQVTAVRRSMTGGRRRFAPGGTGTTDDRGIYRIGRLVPGDYVVAMATSQVSIPVSTARLYEDGMMTGDPNRNGLLQAMFQIGGTPVMTVGTDSRQVGDQVQSMARGTPTPPPADGQRLFAYPSVYYPAAPSAAAATVVTVTSGNERTGVDLQVKTGADGEGVRNRRRRLRIVGELSGAPASARERRSGPHGRRCRDAHECWRRVHLSGRSSRRLHPEDRSDPEAARAECAGGRHRDRQRHHGDDQCVHHSRAATYPGEPTLWATVPVSVGDTDVSGMSVVLSTGLRVSGRVEFEGAADKPSPEQLARIPVLIEPIDWGQMDRNVTPPGRIDVKGHFTSYGVPGGRYYVRAATAPTGWTFKGAFLGERDISDMPLELEATDVSDVVLTFTDRPASLSGTVQLTERSARDGVAVIVFPADAKAWMNTGATPRRMRKVATSDSGSYNIAALPAGSYYVAAVSETVASDWQDPAFLEQLAASAAHVQVGDGEAATQSLRVQEVRR